MGCPSSDDLSGPSSVALQTPMGQAGDGDPGVVTHELLVGAAPKPELGELGGSWGLADGGGGDPTGG